MTSRNLCGATVVLSVTTALLCAQSPDSSNGPKPPSATLIRKLPPAPVTALASGTRKGDYEASRFFGSTVDGVRESAAAGW